MPRIPIASAACATRRAASRTGPPDAPRLPIEVHGQARQHGYRDWVWHVPPEPAGSAFHRDHARSQRVIANHAFVLADDIGARSATHLIGARPALQPIVKGSLPGAEPPDVVVLREGLRRQQPLTSPMARPFAGSGATGHSDAAARRASPETRRRLGGDHKYRAVHQRILGGVTGGVEHEIRSILARQLRRAIDKPAQFRLDPEVQSAARDLFPLRSRHANSSTQDQDSRT